MLLATLLAMSPGFLHIWQLPTCYVALLSDSSESFFGACHARAYSLMSTIASSDIRPLLPPLACVGLQLGTLDVPRTVARLTAYTCHTILTVMIAIHFHILSYDAVPADY